MIKLRYHSLFVYKKGEIMGYKKYTDEFKEKVVREYLGGERHRDILLKYQIHKSVLRQWVVQFKKFGAFPDGRGKSKTGRLKLNYMQDLYIYELLQDMFFCVYIK